MPRMRVIKPEFFDDRKLARCSRDARLLYVGLWTHADEWSRVQGDPRLIKGKLFAYDDDLDQAAITKLLDELAADDVVAVVRYDVAGDPYLYLPKLIRHQRLEPMETPSRLPAPPDFDQDEYLSQPNVKHRTGKRPPNKSGDSPTLFGDDPDSFGPIHGSGIRGQVSGIRDQVEAGDDVADSALDGSRQDVERLCTHLADRIEANGAKRPLITKRWRDAARLMLDRDARTEVQIHTAIDWCQADEFWRANVLSMPKLRDQYEQLRLQAMRSRNGTSRRPTTDEKVAGLLAMQDPEPGDEPDDDDIPPNTIQGSVE